MQYARQTTRPIVMGTRGMVATGHPLASVAALRVLQEGGNAIDAAVSAAAVLAVVLPQACGIGGDVFLLHYDAAADRLTSLNGSGRAPGAASLEGIYRNGIPARGPLSVSVPGAVRGWADALARHGTISLADALGPAIHYAREGFPVSVRLSGIMGQMSPTLRQCSAAATAYLKGGEPYGPGELLRLPDLAASLELIARDGPDAFYRGSIAEAIVSGHRADGGCLSVEDFAGHDSVWGEPLAVDYRGYRVYNQRPVSMGLVLLQELKIVEGFDLGAMAWDSVERIHLLVETKKLAFADVEAHVADPDFHANPIDGLLSAEYGARRRAAIDPRRAAEAVAAGQPGRGENTTYFAVVDGRGNAVSWIQTLFEFFGSCWMAPGTGILLTNRLSGFSSDPGHVNRLEGGKRTVHTLNAPMVFERGRPCLLFGTPGDYGQVQSTLQMLTGFVDHGLDVQAMVEAPRWRHFDGLRLAIEDRFAASTLEGLRRLGHEVDVQPAWTSLMGGAQAVRINQQNGVLEGAADPRRDGYALGW